MDDAPVAAAPLIVTLTLDPYTQERFDRLRREHFPVERNHLAAHVTLFHQLPGAEVDVVQADLARACMRAPIGVTVTGVRYLGRGVAYALSSSELLELRAGLAASWAHWLTPQDRSPYAPHLTVQNKVAPERARALHQQLSTSFAPATVLGLGLALWHYRGRPWEHVSDHAFATP